MLRWIGLVLFWGIVASHVVQVIYLIRIHGRVGRMEARLTGLVAQIIRLEPPKLERRVPDA